MEDLTATQVEAITKIINESTNPNMILLRIEVDNAIYEYSEIYGVSYTMDERNQLILDIFKILEKKYLASPNKRWEKDKKFVTSTIIQSFITKKNLEIRD
jgi:hypothetical protein